MVHAPASVGQADRHQTALRGPAPGPSGTAAVTSEGDASETSPCRRTGQAKRRARPPKGHGVRKAGGGGIETSVHPGRLPSAASAQFICTRSSGRIGWAMAQHRSYVIRSPARGPIQACGVGRRPQRGVFGVEPQKDASSHRGRRWCPSSAYSSPHRAGGRFNASRPVHLFSPSVRRPASLHRIQLG